ncbi:hypothetical protein LOD99_9616 [Oopsacas minuta]|uniref:Uncharacterized protein n=1 Tax=Oopsacas minuta TaxID=111878 RepID=A0AAV7KT85_9METZ|nr:hypothetical protein LOD99_9616 [Oopsacas minuta]
MSYPGEGQKMANYGFKTYTAQQKMDNWKQNVTKEVSIAKSHMNKFTELDSSSGLAALHEKQGETEEINPPNFFNTAREHKDELLYDTVHKFTEGYNPKHHRDDRMHNTKSLSIHKEESGKKVPSLSSSVYGKGAKLESMSRENSRVAHVKRDFYQHTQGIYIQHGISGCYEINKL